MDFTITKPPTPAGSRVGPVSADSARTALGAEAMLNLHSHDRYLGSVRVGYPISRPPATGVLAGIRYIAEAARPAGQSLETMTPTMRRTTCERPKYLLRRNSGDLAVEHRPTSMTAQPLAEESAP